MKKIKFILLLAIIAIYSCKKDKIPAISDITINPNPVGTTRNTSITASVANADNIQWYIDDSKSSSNTNPFSWKATSPGMHILKLEATSKAGSVTKTDTIDVYDFDFRHSFWGDDINTIDNSETNNSLGYSGSYYYYQGDVYNEGVSYYLGSNGLESAAIIYLQEYSDYKNYILDYLGYISKLDQIYGDHEDITIWYDNTYQYDQSNWGTALENYLADFGSLWQTDRDVIMLVLYRDSTDGTLLFGTIYYSIDSLKSTTSKMNIRKSGNLIRNLRAGLKK